MVQPIEGLVLSIPVLVDAQCMKRQPPSAQQKLLDLCPEIETKGKDGSALRRVADLPRFLSELLELTPDLFDAGDALPEDLSLYVPEGKQVIRPTMALRKLTPEEDAPSDTPATKAGSKYVMLLWDLPDGLPFDKAETVTGPWDYPPAAKFDRLLRNCRVPIGLLTNRRAFRLFYAPHGESTGTITFPIDDMATVGGRPILDAFLMLLSATRFFGVAKEHQLPSLLEESRKRQANVTNELAEQVFEALAILLDGFQAAAERDGWEHLNEALEREEDHLYGGLLTVLLRLVFLLYAEDRDLLPVENEFYADNLSILGLFDELQEDHGAYPDSMSRRFGAWSRLVSLFRTVYLGAKHGELDLPPRQGQLFDPGEYPFLEGWGPRGSAPVKLASDRARVRIPSVDDETVFRVLEKLVLFQGQRLSYRTLDVEQIGSVYEALMGYHVVRVTSPAVCLKTTHYWLQASDVLAQAPAQRVRWIQETTGLAKSPATKLADALKGAKTEEVVLEVLDEFRVKNTERAKPGRLVLQPGAERKRTSSHYTPRSLSAPIVKKTLEPLLKALGPEPKSEQILRLTVCDPAMGSGAFLVEACRFLADELVAAWTRENQLEKVASAHEDVVNHARRLVAQRCLYGVDKNRFAVNLAKLSLWLVTLAKGLPFTFLDHALRHGDSLVGLDFDQIKSFHWKPGKQLELCRKELESALDEAITLRQQIQELALENGQARDREKQILLRDAEDALRRVRLIADVILGSFFSSAKDKDREKERTRRQGLVTGWLNEGGEPVGERYEELKALQDDSLEKIPAFHWMIEFPEVFYAGRRDPLGGGAEAGYIDAFIGNPPFAGKNGILDMGGSEYLDWLKTVHEGSHGNADYSAHFFRRADVLLGKHGTIGLIATNTIAQGDTRTTGLQKLVQDGHVLYDATKSLLWPGEAAVAVAVVHSAKGSPAKHVDKHLDGESVSDINSRLRGKPERPDPIPLAANADLSFVGSYVLGMGFVLTPEERGALVAKNPRNAERIFPYLGGEEVNSNPTQSFHRYVINFGQMTLDEAGRWPDLLEILREKVKPERDENKRDIRRKYWWRFGEVAPGIYGAIARLERCLVAGVVSKHLMFSFQPTDRVFSHKLFVFPLPSFSTFAVLQSRVHVAWTWLLSSTMKNDLNYSATDCFENFPFPRVDPREEIPALESAGEAVYETRARFMVEGTRGLTDTYNLLKDPKCEDDRILELRRLHGDMDRATLASYGWNDIDVPPYTTPTTDAQREAMERFEDEIIDRLFVLNALRANEERVVGQPSGIRRGPRRKPSDGVGTPCLPGVTART